jgi:hypothetical protein
MFRLFAVDHQQFIGPDYQLVGADRDAAGLFARQEDAERVAGELCLDFGPIACVVA